MKKFLLLMFALLIVGETKIYAGKSYASFSVANECTWNAGTNTMGFTAVNGWQILLTGLPAGDITGYTKFHATLSSMSDNIENIRLCIKDQDGTQAWYNLVSGENNVNLEAFATANPDCDFTKIADITLWSPSSAKAGETVDGEHPASVVITNVYLQTVKNLVTCTGLGDEITSLAGITDGTKFVITNADASKAMYFMTDDVSSKNAALASVPSNGYFYYQVTKVNGLDTDGDSNAEDDNYLVQIFNSADAVYTHAWNLGSYLNYSQWGHTFAGGGTPTAYGTDFNYGGIWKISYEAGNGFVFQCAGKKEAANPYVYLKVDGTQAVSSGKVYLKLYKSLSFEVNSEFDKEDNEANDAIFALANATGYDAETSTLTNGGWTFATPVDISSWDYLVITTIDNASDGSRKIKIADNNGILVEGNQYSGSSAGTGNDMYLDRWNNQNAIRISIDYLRATKGMDITKIKSLSFANNSGSGDCVLRISNVYLTDYNNTKIAGGYCEGDIKREYTETGKYGTICLPYVASYAGAEIYSIAEKGSDGISLSKVTGLLEAGKPYFYISADANGKNNEGAVRNVNFFRADLAKYDADKAGEYNGLIGTFAETDSETKEIATSNFYILSSNKIYNLEGATGEDKVTIGANKAYIDMTKVPTGGGSAKVMIEFDEPEATGIEDVDAIETLNGKFYDLSGREVTNLVPGIYIVNGKKVVIK